MMGLNPLTTFAAEIQNGFANVVFVGGDGAPIFQLHRLAKNSHQIGPAALGVRTMAGSAAQLQKQTCPFEASVPVAPPPLSQAWYWAGSITTTCPIIPECCDAAIFARRTSDRSPP
jgi:hypothetical protein